MQEDAACVIKVGTHAMSGIQAAYAAWNATFDTYLTNELHAQLNCSFRLVPLLNETAVYTAVSNSTIDLLFTNSGLHVCLEVSSFQDDQLDHSAHNNFIMCNATKAVALFAIPFVLGAESTVLVSCFFKLLATCSSMDLEPKQAARVLTVFPCGRSNMDWPQ